MPAPKKATALIGWLGLSEAKARSSRVSLTIPPGVVPRRRIDFAAAYQSECAAPQPGGLPNKSGKDAATPRRREAATER